MSLTTAGDSSQQVFNNTSKVVDQLGMAIVCGDYPQGTMIPLDPDLEEMFSVSRTVIREAKKTLVAKGLLQSKAKVGTRVRPSSDWSMFDPDILKWHASLRKPRPFLDELFEIRSIFEPAAAALVASRGDAEDHARLSDQCQTMRKAPDYLTFAAANIEFHTLILHLSGNRFLSSLGDMVQAALLALHSRQADQDPQGAAYKDRVALMADYLAIVDAIRDGQPQSAEAAMRRVINAANQQGR